MLKYILFKTKGVFMNSKIKIFFTLFMLIFTVLACSLPEGIAVKDALPYEDDFSSSSSGWDRMTEEDFSTDYFDGYYVISIESQDYMAWANPGKNFSDIHIEVDATYIGGGLDNHFGVICRAVDVDNFYVMMISSDGFYAITKRVEADSLSIIGSEIFEFSDVIRQGVATNHIEVDCIGDTLSLTVNGTLLAEVQDTSFAMGDVGLLAGTFDVEDTKIAFDNFKVSLP